MGPMIVLGPAEGVPWPLDGLHASSVKLDGKDFEGIQGHRVLYQDSKHCSDTTDG